MSGRFVLTMDVDTGRNRTYVYLWTVRQFQVGAETHAEHMLQTFNCNGLCVLQQEQVEWDDVNRLLQQHGFKPVFFADPVENRNLSGKVQKSG